MLKMKIFWYISYILKFLAEWYSQNTLFQHFPHQNHHFLINSIQFLITFMLCKLNIINSFEYASYIFNCFISYPLTVFVKVKNCIHLCITLMCRIIIHEIILKTQLRAHHSKFTLFLETRDYNSLGYWNYQNKWRWNFLNHRFVLHYRSHNQSLPALSIVLQIICLHKWD